MVDKAHIQWCQGGPRCTRFDDIYYNPGQGLAESRAVFLAGCDLPNRWRQADQFVIAETGFGTALNFLVTWQAWQACRRPGQTLHFVSLERYPLSREQLQQAALDWPELEPLSRQLIDRYPVITAGFHRISFPGEALFLTLMIGDVVEVLAQLEARVDAWYLDGFAPSKNPGMWQPEVYSEMARLSRPEARVATFTAAGFVRRGLETAGFAMRRSPGFGSKRERLIGCFSGSPSAPARPAWCVADGAGKPAAVALVGAGLAARCLQDALALRGIQATLLGPQAASASDNPLANVMPRLPADRSPVGRLNWTAFLDAQRYWSAGDSFESVGSLLLATGENESKRQRSLSKSWQHPGVVHSLNAAEASDQAGVSLPVGGIWYPTAGLVAGGVAARAERISQAVMALQAHDRGWRLLGERGTDLGCYDAVVVAAGPGTRPLLPQAYLQLMGFAGQVSFVDPSADSQGLRCTLLGGRYFTPVRAGRHVLGATFAASDLSHPPIVDDQQHQANLHALARALPDWTLGPVSQGWAGLRVTSGDRLPVAGPVIEQVDFAERFDRLRRRRFSQQDAAPMNGGLYVLSGLGSRGFSHARLCAELVVARMLGEPWPLERQLALLLDPARFLVRDLKRGKIQ